MDNMNKFGERLQAAIKAKELSQQQFADRLGTTQQAVSRWINGSRQPDLDTFIRICLWLDETPNDMLGFDEIDKAAFFKAEGETNPLQRKLAALSDEAFNIGAQLGEELGKIWLEALNKDKDEK